MTRVHRKCKPSAAYVNIWAVITPHPTGGYRIDLKGKATAYPATDYDSYDLGVLHDVVRDFDTSPYCAHRSTLKRARKKARKMLLQAQFRERHRNKPIEKVVL